MQKCKILFLYICGRKTCMETNTKVKTVTSQKIETEYDTHKKRQKNRNWEKEQEGLSCICNINFS
jgi:hypothetical protein